MSDQSATCSQATSKASTKLTSSRASQVGRTLFDSLDGPQIEASGPEAAPVSPSRQRASGKGKRTPATSGPSSSDSSPRAALLSCSANKSRVPTLSERLAASLEAMASECGSIEYRQTWKKRVTPSGRVLWAHTASGLRTSDSDCIGPQGWPTPKANERAQSPEAHAKGFLSLMEAAQLTGWPTCTATDAIKGGSVSPRPGAMGLSETVGLTGWSTPRATDGSKGGPGQTGGALPADAALEGRGSPQASDWKGATRQGQRRGQLSEMQCPGPIAEPSSAATGSTAGYRLNPLFSLWLMGFPPDVWGSSGVRAMQSCRKSPRRSSGRSSKAKVKHDRP